MWYRYAISFLQLPAALATIMPFIEARVAAVFTVIPAIFAIVAATAAVVESVIDPLAVGARTRSEQGRGEGGHEEE